MRIMQRREEGKAGPKGEEEREGKEGPPRPFPPTTQAAAAAAAHQLGVKRARKVEPGSSRARLDKQSADSLSLTVFFFTLGFYLLFTNAEINWRARARLVCTPNTNHFVCTICVPHTHCTLTTHELGRGKEGGGGQRRGGEHFRKIVGRGERTGGGGKAKSQGKA